MYILKYLYSSGQTVSSPRAFTPVTPAKQTSGNRITNCAVGTSRITDSFISTFVTSVKPATGDIITQSLNDF